MLNPLSERKIAARSPVGYLGPLAEFWKRARREATPSVVDWVAIYQAPRGPFTIACDAGSILIVCDRHPQNRGPGAFHYESLRAYFQSADRADIVADCVEEPYLQHLDNGTILRQRGLIVEAPQERQGVWARFVREHAPKLPLRSWCIVTTAYPPCEGDA